MRNPRQEARCDVCGAPAVVNLTRVRDGEVTQQHLCARCAEAQGVDLGPGPPRAQA